MDTIDDQGVKGQESEGGKAGAGNRPQKRRQYSIAYKRRVVEEVLKGEESVSIVARRHDINTNLVFTWRKQYLAGRYEGARASSLIPITVTPPVEMTTAVFSEESSESDSSRLEIVLTGGHRVVVEGTVEAEVLRTALEVLTA